MLRHRRGLNPFLPGYSRSQTRAVELGPPTYGQRGQKEGQV